MILSLHPLIIVEMSSLLCGNEIWFATFDNCARCQVYYVETRFGLQPLIIVHDVKSTMWKRDLVCNL